MVDGDEDAYDHDDVDGSSIAVSLNASLQGVILMLSPMVSLYVAGLIVSWCILLRCLPLVQYVHSAGRHEWHEAFDICWDFGPLAPSLHCRSLFIGGGGGDCGGCGDRANEAPTERMKF